MKKKLQIKIEFFFPFSVWLPFCNFQLRIDLKANKGPNIEPLACLQSNYRRE